MPLACQRVVFLNRFFFPDHSATSEILSELAFGLSKEGIKVEVITSRLRYDDASPLLAAREVIHGIQVFRVWTSQHGRQRLWGRALDYASFYMAAGCRLWRSAAPDTIIVAMTDPPLSSVMAAIVARLRGAKLVNWHQDIFPEVAEAVELGGLIGHLGLALLHVPRNWSLRCARMNIVVGQRMAKTVRRLGVAEARIRVIPNWADSEHITPVEPKQNFLRAAWGLNKSFVVGYAGNLGRAHEIGTVLGAMTLLNQTPSPTPIKFLFVGGGSLRCRLEKAIATSDLTNTCFRDYQPRAQVSNVLGAADIHIVILNPKMEGLVVPSKIYAIAAAGRPAIFVGDPKGELADIISDGGFGFVVPSGNVESLRDRILQLARSPTLSKLMGTRARSLFEQQWDKTLAVQRWKQLLADITNGPLKSTKNAFGPRSDQGHGSDQQCLDPCQPDRTPRQV